MSVNKEIASLFISPDTGEITNELYFGDKIIRSKTTEYLQNTVEIGKNEKFIKLFENTITALGEESLTGNEWKVLFAMVKYFRYDSGLVSYDNGKPLYIENICELSKVGERTVFKSIDKLVSKKIIAKNKVGHLIKYYMNPFIFSRGKRVNRTLYTMFENSKWRHLHQS